ncbi:MAG TPA: carboxypeptidase-like regulatory domain-containing protein [Fibrobacteria bacterium]|nr:carboxypeptidase-like regulatory domain-containing protein [Fibrobacteria bacterium]
MNVALAPSNGGSRNGAISGTVKDDSTKEAIKNATVILSHPAGRGGPTPIDTVLTDGEGRFFFPVPAASNYIVTASASGYSEASENGIDAASRDTVRVPLTLKKLPKPSSAVVGKVTDAGTKEAINGADVILRRRTASPTGVQTWTNIDTVQSGGDGAFKFENLAASTAINPYSLLVSKADYNNATSGNIVVGNNQTDTANVALTKVAKGSMSIFVGLDSATNPALAGAAVAATLTAPSGEVYTGTTDAKGWVTFPSVIAGAYSVSANLDGYVSKVAARTVTANEKDTGYVYLARATAQNSKSLSGLVRDADGKAVQGAKVIFEGNGANGIVLAATSSATGDYAFRGIPTNVNGGTVTVQMNGFAEFTAAVTLTGAASFLNVTLKKPVSLSRQAREAGLLRFARSGSVLTLEFPAVAEAGSLSLYDARGVLVDAVRIPAGAVHAGLSAPSRSGAGFMILKQGASLRRLSLPAAP